MKNRILISVVLLSACAGGPSVTSSPEQYGFASSIGGTAAQREKRIAEENGWRIWEISGERSGRLRIKVGSDERAICIAVKPVPGSPWPVFSTDYRYVSGGKGFYMRIEDSETIPYFGFFGQHPYRWPAEVKAGGQTVADTNNRDTVLAWEGQDVPFRITTQPSAESYKETTEDTGILNFTGVREAYRRLMACHERSQ